MAASPLVEIGAGTGYWSAMIAQAGGDVIAYDSTPPGPGNNYHPDPNARYFDVQQGGTEKAALHPDRTLFLCWPPYGEIMAWEALVYYKGSTLVYVGEGQGGCTGNDAFHELLDAQWEERLSLYLPNWQGIRDTLTVYQRL